MAERNNYNGSVELISGLKPKNNGNFPLVHAHDVQVDSQGTRLDEKLSSIGDGLSPTIDVVDVEGGVNIVITDKNGTKTVFVPNGSTSGGGSGTGGSGTSYRTVSVFSANVLTDGSIYVANGSEYFCNFQLYREIMSTDISQCKVFMDGEDITSTDKVSYVDGSLTIHDVNGDIEITFDEIPGEYYEREEGDCSVKLVLANVYVADGYDNTVIYGNGSRYIAKGDPFYVSLNAINGETSDITYTVTQDGEDITSDCQGDVYGLIYIGGIGGDIVITATAPFQSQMLMTTDETLE